MRLLSILNYGTARYPENIARRLRVLNAATWFSAGFVASFAIYDLLDRSRWTVGFTNVLFMIFFATVPLWHRFGSLAAPLAFVVGAYCAIYVICSMLGTDSGMQVQYLAVAAALILFVGSKRAVFIALVSALGVALVIALEVFVPHDTGLLSRGAMLGNFVACVVGTCLILLSVVFYAVRETDRAQDLAEREYQRSESLLVNILPASIATRLKSSPASVIADTYDRASILFADMAGFTARSGDTVPEDLVRFLNRVFTDFDRLVERHGLEKRKTTGDGYVVVSGVPNARDDHAEALAELALDLLDATSNLMDPHGRSVRIRVGIASGPMVGGVVGTRKFFYDVWGDTVNVASRMESTGIPGKIQVADSAYERLKHRYVLQARGRIDVKGKGLMATWFLVGRQGWNCTKSIPTT